MTTNSSKDVTGASGNARPTASDPSATPHRARALRRALPPALLLAAVASMAGCAEDPSVVAGAHPSTGPSIVPILPAEEAAPQVARAAQPGNGRASRTR